MASTVKTESYHSAKVDAIRQVVEKARDFGQQQEFDIVVDNFKVVQRSSNPEQFDSFVDFINADTKSVTITLYKGSSRSYDRYIFLMKDNIKPEDLQGLNPVVNQKKIRQETEEAIRKEIEYDNTIKENAELKEAIKEYEAYIKKLQQAVLERRQFKWAGLDMGEFGSALLEGIIRRNPQLISKIPGGEALAGAFQHEEKTENAAEPDCEASFTKKSAEADNLTETDKQLLDFLKGMKRRFTVQEIEEVFFILKSFAEDKSLINAALKLIIK